MSSLYALAKSIGWHCSDSLSLLIGEMVVLVSHAHTAYLAECLVEDVTREAVSANVGGFGGVENDSFLLRIDPSVGVLFRFRQRLNLHRQRNHSTNPHADTAVALGCFIFICFIQRLAHESQGDCAAMTGAGVEFAAVDGRGQRPVMFGRCIFVSESSAIVPGNKLISQMESS